MSTQIDQVLFQIGIVPGGEGTTFNPSCRPGDWQSYPVTFTRPFPAPPRVIATSNNDFAIPPFGTVPVVCVIQKVTPSGFILAARNPTSLTAGAGFFWMAVLETPGSVQSPPDLRMGVLQPRPFRPGELTSPSGPSYGWWVPFSTPLAGPAVVLLTPSNVNVSDHNAAVVGTIETGSLPGGCGVDGYNSDCAWGDCAFYYVALSQQAIGSGSLWVDSGTFWFADLEFNSNCTWGDWLVSGFGTPDIFFHRPFQTPPVVLLTANDVEVSGHNAAAVGIAQNVTTTGFRLAARNSDCAPGQAGFYWVAIGCALGCG